MILGYFNSKNRPFVKAHVRIDVDPNYQINGQMDFLVDTGSDSTFVMPDDGKLALKIDYRKVPAPSVPVQTPFGPVRATLCTAYIGFEDAHQPVIHQYNVKILVYPDTQLFSYRPSALGRDIFDYWHIDYSLPRNNLSFDVTRADRTIQLP
jgi:hypothetical protein